MLSILAIGFYGTDAFATSSIRNSERSHSRFGFDHCGFVLLLPPLAACVHPRLSRSRSVRRGDLSAWRCLNIDGFCYSLGWTPFLSHLHDLLRCFGACVVPPSGAMFATAWLYCRLVCTSATWSYRQPRIRPAPVCR